MQMDNRIILAGEPVNALGSFMGGQQAAQQTRQFQQQNALADLYKTQGAGIMSGDANALNALAGIDPQAAMQFKTQQQGMAMDQRRLEILNEQEKRAAAEYAAGLTAQQREAEAAQIEDAVKMGLSIPDAATWDATMGQMAPELVGKFDLRQALANRYMSMVDILKAQEPVDPVAGAPSGYQWADPKNKGVGVVPLVGYQAAPLSSPGKVQADIDAGILPAGTPLSSPQNTINVGGNSSEFTKESDKAAAQRLGEIVQSGNSAPAMLSDLQALKDLAPHIGTGKGAQITAALGPYAQALGVDIAGLGEAQAYDAIVARMAPMMRTPGAGASSDFDARQFLKSLPSLGNTPEGNALIIKTFENISAAKIRAGEIARAAQRGEISWQDAEAQIAKIADPFAEFKGANGKSPKATDSPNDGYTIEEIK